MKRHFYRFIYNLLSGLSNRIPHKIFIRYKLLVGALLLNLHPSPAQESVLQEKEPEQLKNISPQDSNFTSLPDTATQIVKGRVLDDNQTPLQGVSIFVERLAIGTVSDQDGNFTLQVPGHVKKLKLDYIGFKSLTVQVEPVIEVVLEENEAILCYEVIVVGYKEKKKKETRQKKNKKE